MYGSIAQSRRRAGVRQRLAGGDDRSAARVCTSRSIARRLTASREGGWIPRERLTLRQAIDAYTRDAAWASFDEHRKGSLERDMLADIVILSKDIFSLPPARLAEAEVAVTIFDGKVVYQRSTERPTTSQSPPTDGRLRWTSRRPRSSECQMLPVQLVVNAFLPDALEGRYP